MLDFNLCVECADVITDPICGGCYLVQIKAILKDLEVHSLAQEVILDKIKKSFPIETEGYLQCIVCNRENVTLCGYCFSIKISRILRELNITEEFIGEFNYPIKFNESFLEDQIPFGMVR